MLIQIPFQIVISIVTIIFIFFAYYFGWIKIVFRFLSKYILDIKYSKTHVDIGFLIVGFILGYFYFKAGVNKDEEVSLRALMQSIGVAIAVLILKVPFEDLLNRLIKDLTLRRFPQHEFAYDFLVNVLDENKYDDRIYIFGGDLDFLWDIHYRNALEKLARKRGEEIYIVCYDPRRVSKEKGLQTIRSVKRLMSDEFCVEKIFFTLGKYKGVILSDIIGIMVHEPLRGRLEYVRALTPPGVNLRPDWMYYSTDKQIIAQMNKLAEDICLINNEINLTTVEEIESNLNR